MKGRLHLPPCPPGLPILGNLHQMAGALPHRSLWELSLRHGPVMMLRLGRVPVLVVSSAEAVRDVLKTHDADCCTRPDMPGPRRISYNHKDLSFTPYSEHWRQMRKLFVLEFRSKKLVQAIWETREAEVHKLMGKLASAGREPVFVEDRIFGCMDDIIGTVAFGNIYGAEQFVQRQHFRDVINEAMIARSSFCAEDYFPNTLGRLVDRLTGLVSRREMVFKEFDAFFETIIEHHLNPSRIIPDQGEDLIDDLIDALMKEEQGSLRFGRERVKALLSNIYIGAVDTGSVTIVWAMTELIRNPRVLKKVQHEIRTVVGNKERVQQDDFPALKYLRMVVLETLRLHPAFPLLVPRETMRQIKVTGYDVPAKTRLLVNAWAMGLFLNCISISREYFQQGRDQAYWDNPEQFNPDRFECKNVNFNGTAHFEYVPFSAGRRMCPGVAVGLATIEFFLANMLYHFDWELPDGMTTENINVEEAGGLTVHKKTPLVLVPTIYKPHLADQLVNSIGGAIDKVGNRAYYAVPLLQN
ncbi:unnamed protein product [Urochloa decumbens]|uniref:Cytochrome P450 n=1 Tax=Urochloa decumbens TaxID=240449 RepID=A0ABC8XEM3_9POAL